MTKITLNSPSPTMEEAFDNFLFAKSAQGVTEKTLKGYKSHFHCISKHLDTTIELDSLTKEMLHQMIASMRASNVSANAYQFVPKMEKYFEIIFSKHSTVFKGLSSIYLTTIL